MTNLKNTPASYIKQNNQKEYETVLPHSLKQALEYLSGVDLSEVHVHYNSAKPCEVMALAYACGADIYLSEEMEHLLPHESWHIVQQMQGRVIPTSTINGLELNDQPDLEREADVMGGLAQQIADAYSEGYIEFVD